MSDVITIPAALFGVELEEPAGPEPPREISVAGTSRGTRPRESGTEEQEDLGECEDPDLGLELRTSAALPEGWTSSVRKTGSDLRDRRFYQFHGEGRMFFSLPQVQKECERRLAALDEGGSSAGRSTPESAGSDREEENYPLLRDGSVPRPPPRARMVSASPRRSNSPRRSKSAKSREVRGLLG